MLSEMPEAFASLVDPDEPMSTPAEDANTETHIIPDHMPNKENYYLRREDDSRELLRPFWVYSYPRRDCPFNGGDETCADDIMANWWSLESAEHVKSYIKHHGVTSNLHGCREPEPLEEFWIGPQLQDAANEIEYKEDTYDMREEYRQRKEKEEEDRRAGKGGKGKHKCKGKGEQGITTTVSSRR